MLGVLGDLGGIFEVTMIVFGFFLFPVSEHSFILKAARLLYYARTRDQKLLDKQISEKEEKLEKFLDASKYTNIKCSNLKSELSKHHIIRLTPSDNIKLFISNIIKGFCCNVCWKKKEKL